MTDEQPAKRGPGRPRKNPVGRPSTYLPEYCDKVIELGDKGYSKTQIAVALEVTKGTLDNWAAAHPEFLTALTRAHEASQSWWEDMGMAGLTSDKFNSAVWSKSMSARFRDEYTERKETAVQHSGNVEVNVNFVSAPKQSRNGD